MPPRLRFRDRFYTPRVARALTSPSAILATGATAAVGVVALGPFGVLAGLVGYAVRVALAIPRNERGERIDPFAVNEPWRRFVSEALQSQRRFDDALHGMAEGPLRDRLGEIGDRLSTGVEECWRIARRAQSLSQARRQVDPGAAHRELAQLQADAGAPWATGPRLEQTAQALKAQIAAAERMDAVIADAIGRLRLIDARLDESVTRAIELSVQADTVGELGGLDADVDGLVTEMEALRQALEETSGRPPTMPGPPPTSAAGSP